MAHHRKQAFRNIRQALFLHNTVIVHFHISKAAIHLPKPQANTVCPLSSRLKFVTWDVASLCICLDYDSTDWFVSEQALATLSRLACLRRTPKCSVLQCQAQVPMKHR